MNILLCTMCNCKMILNNEMYINMLVSHSLFLYHVLWFFVFCLVDLFMLLNLSHIVCIQLIHVSKKMAFNLKMYCCSSDLLMMMIILQYNDFIVYEMLQKNGVQVETTAWNIQLKIKFDRLAKSYLFIVNAS